MTGAFVRLAAVFSGVSLGCAIGFAFGCWVGWMIKDTQDSSSLREMKP